MESNRHRFASRSLATITVLLLVVGLLAFMVPSAAATPPGGAAATNWFKWNWQNPSPQGNFLGATWGADVNHVWAVGGGGTILAWNGFNWVQQPSGTTSSLFAVSGVDASHVWASGENGTILFYNGSSWVPQNSHTTVALSGLTALDASHVWAAGDSGVIRFFNGSSWVTQASGTTTQFYGASALDSHHVWVVGHAGAVLFFNGTTWAVQASTTINDVFDVSAVDAHHVWAVGRDGTVIFFNGTVWSTVNAGTATTIISVSALDASHVWVGGLNGMIRFFNGSTWSVQGPGLTANVLNGVFALDRTHVWEVGDNGVILAFNGSAWAPQSSGTEPGEGFIEGISAADANHAWAVGVPAMSPTGAFILSYDGARWSPQKTNLPYLLYGVSALDAKHVWACGSNGTIIFFNGASWTAQGSGTADSLGAISALDAAHVWAVSDAGKILFFNGSTWTVQANFGASITFSGVSALDARHVWAVGSAGKIAFFNGSAWSTQANLGASVFLNGVEAVTANRVWAVGDNGAIKFFNGATWSAQSSGVTESLKSVTAIDASHVWVGGTLGDILFFNGKSWARQTNPMMGNVVTSMTSVDVNHVWAAGAGTSILLGSQEATTWYLAEGSSMGGFETWILVQNPGDVPAKAQLTYMTGSGQVAGPSLTLTPHTRQSVNVADTVKDFSVSTKVTSDNPVVCERAMYFDNRVGGHGSIGTIAPANTWFLAEGSTAGGFETWVLVQNPGDVKASGKITYMTPTGEVAGPDIALSPHTRLTVRVNDTVSNNYSVSTLVSCDHPVIAERATYWNGRTAGQESIGVTNPAQQWFLAEGATAGGFETWVLLENPGSLPAKAHLTYMTPSGQVAGPDVNLAPRSRMTTNVGDTVSNNYSVSTTVTCDQPIVAERAMYWNNRAGGHDSVGVTQAATSWFMAEGVTASPFQTWILVQNPGNKTAKAQVTYMTNSGQVTGPALTLAPHSRQTVNVADTVANNFNVATTVTSDNPVVAERATYWNNRSQDGTESIGFTP